MRKKILAGNWKLNKNLTEVREFFLTLNDKIIGSTKASLTLICPSAIYLQEASILTEKSSIIIGAQDVSVKPSGAWTGEISAKMLAACNINYAIVGHSERRNAFGESNKDVNSKLQQLRENKITPILCVGENDQERENGETVAVIENQLIEGLKGIEVTIDDKLIIAYEPVWAIGTGKTATPEMAEEVHAFIRKWIKDNYDEHISNMTSILYGGSVKPENFESLLAQENIDGGLVGGASLDVESFYKMYEMIP